jgi:hypothetical protein
LIDNAIAHLQRIAAPGGRRHRESRPKATSMWRSAIRLRANLTDQSHPCELRDLIR